MTQAPRQFLLSYPARRWHIRGGENFRSEQRAAADPREALREWIRLAEAIEQLGAEVIVLPPEDCEPPLTGMVYTANAGALFIGAEPGGKGSRFVVSEMAVAHRRAEAAPIARFFAESMGLDVTHADATWEGQADICHLPGERYLLTYGVRSVEKSVSDVQSALPPGSLTLPVRLRDPFFHGDTCLNPIRNREGQWVLLACPDALDDGEGRPGLTEIDEFCSGAVEVLPVSREDALAYACNALEVDGTVLAPPGLSRGLLDALAARRFNVMEMQLSELFGKGGGGPRCLVNELRGLSSALPELPEALTFKALRKDIGRLILHYPNAKELAAELAEG